MTRVTSATINPPAIEATPTDPRFRQTQRRSRAALAVVAAAVVLSGASIAAVLTFTAYSPAPGFADVVREDSRLDAFAPLSDSDTEALGQLVCAELNAERGRIDLANQIAEDHEVSTDTAVAFVRVAITHVCPHHD
jgi:hypothetical protein